MIAIRVSHKAVLVYIQRHFFIAETIVLYINRIVCAGGSTAAFAEWFALLAAAAVVVRGGGGEGDRQNAAKADRREWLKYACTRWYGYKRVWVLTKEGGAESHTQEDRWVSPIRLDIRGGELSQYGPLGGQSLRGSSGGGRLGLGSCRLRRGSGRLRCGSGRLGRGSRSLRCRSGFLRRGSGLLRRGGGRLLRGGGSLGRGSRLLRRGGGRLGRGSRLLRRTF